MLTVAKIYDKRDDFDLEIVNFPFLDGDDPRSISFRLYDGSDLKTYLLVRW